jgi:hypothetical protein
MHKLAPGHLVKDAHVQTSMPNPKQCKLKFLFPDGAEGLPHLNDGFSAHNLLSSVLVHLFFQKEKRA